MKNFYYEGQRFKNGNLNIRFSPEEIADIKSGKFSAPEVLGWKLSSFDSYFIGETYCLSNFATGHTVYNAYNDCIYIVNWADVDSVLMAGKTLKLYARTPDESDREIIESEGL